MIPVDPILVAVLRLGVALLLLSSAWHKLRDMTAFRAALTGYTLLPPRLVPVAACFFAGAEGVLGIGLLLPQFSPRAACGGAMLLAIYTTAILVNLARGRTRIDCGCAGPAGTLPVSRALVLRNALLIVLAIGAASPSAPRELHVTDVIIVIIATLTFAFLYAATETALANVARWRHAQGRSLGADAANA